MVALPLSESQSSVASITVSKEGGNSNSGRDRPTKGGPGPKEKKYLGPLAQRKKNSFNDYIYIYLFISRVVPRSSKNLNSLSFN